MITFNQLATRAYDLCGKPNDNGITTANITMDINQGLKLFKDAARRYWTRGQASASLVSSQQDYQMPVNFVRATQVTITANGIVYPLEEVQSEKKWNQLNIIPQVTIYIPTRFFIKGYNVISIWPAPTTAMTGTLNVSFEPRMADYSLPDVTGTATVTNGSITMTDSGTRFTQQMVNQWMQITDGTDGYWYPISAFTSTSSINLSNYFQGITGSGRSYIIGAAPDIPDDYHMALAFYASAMFYLKRKDNETAQMYLGMFNDLRDQYIDTFSSKTTGVIVRREAGAAYSVFGLPPFNLH
jgi:hypothetical protein